MKICEYIEEVPSKSQCLYFSDLSWNAWLNCNSDSATFSSCAVSCAPRPEFVSRSLSKPNGKIAKSVDFALRRSREVWTWEAASELGGKSEGFKPTAQLPASAEADPAKTPRQRWIMKRGSMTTKMRKIHLSASAKRKRGRRRKRKKRKMGE